MERSCYVRKGRVVDNGAEGTNKIEVSSGFVSSGALSSADEGPRGLPLVKRPIMYSVGRCGWVKSPWRLCEVVIYVVRVNAYAGRHPQES